MNNQYEKFIEYITKKVNKDFNKQQFALVEDTNILKFMIRSNRYTKSFRKTLEFISVSRKGALPNFNHYINNSKYTLVGGIFKPNYSFYYIDVTNNFIKSIRITDTHLSYIEVEIEL